VRLRIEGGNLYIDNVYFCKAGTGNGRNDLQSGTYPITTQYSHAHGDILPNAAGAGWIGFDDRCDIVLGGVRYRSGVVPSKPFVGVILAKLEVAEGRGQNSVLEIR